jgi:hypothetical protein
LVVVPWGDEDFLKEDGDFLTACPQMRYFPVGD